VATGANQVQISLNRGALPHEMFMEQIRRFAREVLPALQAHEVVRVPLAEDAVGVAVGSIFQSQKERRHPGNDTVETM
jgi:hypothetical protein